MYIEAEVRMLKVNHFNFHGLCISYFQHIYNASSVTLLYSFTTQSWLLTTIKKKALKNIVGKGENVTFSHSVFYCIKESNYLFSNA